MPTPNLNITLPTVGGSTDSWGTELNAGITIIDDIFAIGGTDLTMSDIKFNSVGLQETGAGTDTVKFQAPAAVTQYTLTMPGAVGSSGQALRASDASGTLEWYTPADVGDITSVVAGAGMTGGGTSGAVTLNVIGTADKITVSADAVTIATTYVGQTSITTLGTIATGTWQGSVISGDYIDVTTSPLANTKIWIGDSSGDAQEFALSGDATMTAGGVVSVTAPAGDLTGTTLKSTVVSSSLTSVGTIATGVWNGTAISGDYIDVTTSPLANTKIWIGDSSGDAQEFALSGDVTMTAGGAVTVADNAITLAKLEDGTQGDILYYGASGAPARLGAGSDGDVLTSGGAGANPTWETSTTGDITGVTAGTGLSGGGTSGDVTLNVDASQTQITSVGALNAGSITSGFGAIDVGSSNIDGGTITADTALVGTLSTAAQTNITSVGTLTSITTSGNAQIDGDLTVGDGGAEDQKIVLNGNAQDYYIGLDDGTDDFMIGLGSTVGTTPAIAIDENQKISMGSSISYIGKDVNFASNQDNVLSFESSTTKWGIYAYDRSGGGAGYRDMSFGAAKIFIKASDGYVGINDTTPSYQLEVNGTFHCTGALSKGSGSFRIDHPLKPETHELVHSFVEGSRADLIYRGVVSLSDGWAEVDLDEVVGLTEGTWAALCRDPQVWVQNDSGWDAVKGSVSGSTLTIICQASNSYDEVSWLVIAERQDDHICEADWTDSEGHPILEPRKSDG